MLDLIGYRRVESIRGHDLMEELHTDSIDGGSEASYGARSRARERVYSNTPTQTLTGSGLDLTMITT